MVILFGVSVDFRLNYGKSLPKKVDIININRSAMELKMNTDIFWKPKISIKTDVCTFGIYLFEQFLINKKGDCWIE